MAAVTTLDILCGCLYPEVELRVMSAEYRFDGSVFVGCLICECVYCGVSSGQKNILYPEFEPLMIESVISTFTRRVDKYRLKPSDKQPLGWHQLDLFMPNPFFHQPRFYTYR